MKKGDTYTHYNGGIYTFKAIALPAKLVTELKPHLRDYRSVRYHENTHDITLYLLDDATFIDADVAHVIYHSVETGILWAREVDDFFGHVSAGKRFTFGLEELQKDDTIEYCSACNDPLVDEDVIYEETCNECGAEEESRL